MPDTYFRSFNVAEIVDHIRLFRKFLENSHAENEPLTPAISWESFPEQDTPWSPLTPGTASNCWPRLPDRSRSFP